MTPLLKTVFALALATAGVVAVWVRSRDYYAKLKKPGSSLIELCEPIVALGSQTMTPAPTGTQIRLPCNLEAVLKVTSAPSGGSPKLNVWFQSSADNGLTWQDFACVTTSTTGTYYFPLSTVASPWSPVNFVGFETGDFSQCAPKPTPPS